jgi:hypothetical protein
MRASASSIKDRTAGSKIQDVPAEGTRLRKYFDLALTGEWFDFLDVPQHQRSGVRRPLVEFYELEFITRIHPNPIVQRGGNTRQYKCVGRWDGAELMVLDQMETAIEYTKQGALT